MARLPVPGSDDGVWGSILNTYLNEAHNADGTLKDGSVKTAAVADASITSAKITDASITGAKLAPNTISESNLATSVITKLNGTGVVRLKYSGTAYPARPVGLATGMAEYVGPTQPTDWTDGDTWVDIS